MSEEESLLAEADSTPSEESTETSTDTPEVTPWYISEGVEGTGDKPEFLQDKYKSLSAQAEAYPELASKLGGFTGSPEGEYELSFPDGVEGEWIEGDPLMDGFQTWAKETNLSQDKFTELLHMYVGNESQMVGNDRESELAAIGDNAQGRLQNISDFAKANLSEEHYQGILAATTTAAGVQAIEALIAQTRSPKIPTDQLEPAPGMSKADIDDRMNDPRYQSSPEFRAETSKMYERLLGKGPKHTVVG